jgi:ATP-dependent DNA ligase
LRREWPFFSAFDLLSLEDQDLRGRPLIERKRQLHRLIPRTNSRLLYVDHIDARGVDLFREASARDLEGIVGKWRRGRYHTDGTTTSWVKIKNAEYSQGIGRHELFERRGAARRTRHHSGAPMLRLA